MTLIVTLFSFFRPFAFSDSCVVKLYIKVPVQIVTVHHNLLIPIKIRNIYQDYTSFSLYYQIKLPLDLEISIPSDDPVQTPTGGSSGEYCTMGASLMQPCRVYEEGLRVVKYFQRGGRE